VDDLWATKSEDVGLIVRAISFQDVVLIHQRHRRTDGQTDKTTCDSKTALCTVLHRAVKTERWWSAGVVICLGRRADLRGYFYRFFERRDLAFV